MVWQLKSSLHPPCVVLCLAGEELPSLFYAAAVAAPFALFVAALAFPFSALASAFAASAIPFALFAAESGASAAQ